VTAIKCPACGGDQLSREGHYASFETHAIIHGETISPGRARVCLTCGYMLLFVSDTERRKLGGT
jgi:hypothetical protein